MNSMLTETLPRTSVFRADTIGKEADRRLKRLLGASVNATYDGAVNVTTGLGLVSFVPLSTGRGPINVTIDGDFRLMRTSAAIGDAVSMTEEAILIGSRAAVSLAGSTKYNPSWKFSRLPLPPGLIRRNVQLARETAIIQGNFSGMGSLLHSMYGDDLRASPVGLNLYSLFALPHLRTLIRGLRDEDIDLVKTAVKHVVGLGVGLTPSADDVLSGLMVALVLCAKNMLAPGPPCTRAVRAMAQASAGRSTSLSEEYLEQASLGRSNERVTALIEGICSGTPAEVVTGASDLVAMGHASGTDTIVGVILGVTFVLQNCGRR